MKKFILVLTATLLALGVTSCGASAPKTADAQHAIDQHMRERSDGRVGVVGFEKTDGQRKTSRGIETYVLYFRARAQVLVESCYTWRNPGNPYYICDELSLSAYQLQEELYRMNRGESEKWTVNLKGDEYPIEGYVMFEKRESGWVVFMDGGFFSERGYDIDIVED